MSCTIEKLGEHVYLVFADEDSASAAADLLNGRYVAIVCYGGYYNAIRLI